MSSIDDGGSAFPFVYGPKDRADGETCEGMTLRDYFAAKALQGFCANPAVFAANPNCGWGLVNMDDETLAARCRGLADAMIIERRRNDGR